MLELLAETSQLTAASLLRPPLSVVDAAAPEAVADPVHTWHQRVQQLVQPPEPHLFKAVAFALLQACTDALFPHDPAFQPVLHRYRDALWCRGEGALYDGHTGLALPGSFLTRFPRHRQAPACTTFRLELRQPLAALPRLERALLVPVANCSDFGHFFTETLGFLWPFLQAGSAEPAPELADLVGCPVLLRGCRPEEPLALALHALLRQAHSFPLLEWDLPDVLHLEEVWIPQPSLRLQAEWSVVQRRSAEAFTQWLLPPAVQERWRDPARPRHKLYISRSALGPQARPVDQEPALEALLEQQGWRILRPEQMPLPALLEAYTQAAVVAGFEGSALHALAGLGCGAAAPALVLLGDQPSLDYQLQFRAQALRGFFIQCTRRDPASEQPPWLCPRLLNGSVASLAAMVDQLASAVL